MKNESQIRLMHIVGRLALAGTEYNVIKLLNSLDRDSFVASIVALETSPVKVKTLIGTDAKVFELSKEEGFDSQIVLHLAKLFRQQRVDIIHSHNWTTFLYSVLAGRLARVPVILHGEHGRDTAQYECDWKKLWMRKNLASLCDHLTTVSPDIANILRGTWGVSRWKISLIPNGVDLRRFKPVGDRGKVRQLLGLDKDAPIIGTVIGCIRPVKDLPTLFKAFELARRKVQSLQLLLVGHDPSSQVVQNLSNKMRVTESVHFLGMRSDIPRIMSTLDIYVNSSVYEGMSNTLLEAMACGLPVLATAVGGTPSIVQNEYNGLLVPPKDPKKMSEAIRRLLSDKSLCEAIAINARQYVTSHHNFASTIEKYRNLYLHWYYEKKRFSENSRTKLVVKRMFANGCKSFGVLRWRYKFGDRPIYVINYHRILLAHELRNYIFPAMALSVSVFERQMDFFRRNCNVISLEECVGMLREELPVPERAVVLTFDDGYQEIYTLVRPILEKYGLPVTICVAVGGMKSKEPLWYDDLAERLQRSDLSDLEFLNGLPSDLKVILKKMKDILPGERAKYIRNAIQTIILLDHDQKMSVLEQLLKIEPDGGRLNHALLSWDMVKVLSQSALFTFGSHGVRHVPLDLLCEEELDEELQSSKQVLEQCAQKPVSVFSYPWGRFNERVKNRVKEAGYLCALRLSDSPNYRGQDLFEVRRVDAAYLTLNHSFHDGAMVAELSGLNHMRRSLLRRSAANEIMVTG